ncbi:MAG: DUF4974 domain-containing protein [Cyclobacteriaceae bacterium]|nr:DUF4974 domain-containing protein [Cyclobacteriaceae bacterium]
MRKNSTNKLVKKYISNECSKDEDELIENWLIDPQKRVSVNKLMKSQWEEYDSSSYKNEFFNAHALLDKVHTTIQSKNVAPLKTSNKPWYSFQWMRIAAILLLPMISIGVYYTLSNPEQTTESIAYSHIENKSGQKSKIYLPDGSKVWLNAESKLSFPQKFVGNKREVSLEGEAFFEVVENPDLPFIVTTADINIKVLGTSFNVSAFPEDLVTETTLETGSVALKKVNSNEDFLMLEPNQKATYSKKKQSFAIKNVDPSFFTSWKDGRLKFHNTSFDEVATKLERWYGVEIQYPKTLSNEYHLTFTLNNESLEKILQLMKTLVPVSYHIDGKNVKIELK